MTHERAVRVNERRINIETSGNLEWRRYNLLTSNQDPRFRS
jgi:hypothetical protein